MAREVAAEAATADEPEGAGQLPLDLGWGDGADLELFVARGDAEAVAAIRALACGRLSRLMLNGAAGCGKTHLLQAACAEVGVRGGRAVYLPLRTLVRHSPDFCQGLEAMELIAIDDGDLLQGQPAWQEALFHLYNRTLESGASLVFASRRRPDRLDGVLADLSSRLRSGLVLRLSGLDDDGCLEALMRRAERRGLALPEAVGRYLLTRYSRDTAALFRALERMDAASLARSRPLTIPLVREVLGGPGEG